MTRHFHRFLCVAAILGLAAIFGARGADAKDPVNEPAKKPAESKADDKAKADDKEKTPKIEITVDTTDAPEMAAYAEKAKKACEENLPMILKHLGAPGFKPPAKTKIVFKKKGGVAETSGDVITCSAKWFTDNPDDMGAVIHELCHVVQSYGGRHQPPVWVTEGIADYVRWFNYEPEKRHPHIAEPEKAKYTDSYQTTAAFFNWIVEKKDPRFIVRMNEACRKGKYKPELFKTYTGSSLDDLWAEFVKSQKK